MYYRFLEIRGYKRIRRSGHESLAIRLDSPLQILLGQNGCGKSSLMQLITALPPNPNDFVKPGYKIIHVFHKNRLYILGSVFASDPKYKVSHEGLTFEVGHSFFVDGEDLNPGGTQTVQRELVFEHFGLTNDIHGLLLMDKKSKNTFCTMSTKDRKEWILRLCETNWDYALKAYNKLREKHRDTVGALKIAKKSLVHESEKLLADDEEKRLREETLHFHELLSKLLELRKPIEDDDFQLQRDQDIIDKTLLNLAAQVDVWADRAFEHDDDESWLIHIEANIQRPLVHHQTMLGHLSDQARGMQSKIEVLKRAEAQSIESLVADLQINAQEIDELSQALLVPTLNRPEEAYAAYQSVGTALTQVFAELPVNPERKYSGQSLQQAREKLDAVQRQKSMTLERLTELKTRLKHMEHHQNNPDLKCPKCQHDFSAFYDGNKHERYKANIETEENHNLPALNAQLKELEEFLEACIDYGRLQRQYQSIRQGLPALAPYWSWLDDLQFLYTEPSRGIYEYQRIEGDIHLHVKLSALARTRQEKQNLLSALQQVGNEDLQALLQQHTQTLDQIELHTQKAQHFTQLKQEAQSERARLKLLKEGTGNLVGLIRKKQTLHHRRVETQRRAHYNQFVRQVQSALAAREHRLNSLNEQIRIVAVAQTHVTECERDLQALDLLVKELSPTEGIIAEGLMGFIRRFTAQMNELIAQVWTYSMVIQAPRFGEDNSVDLDYYFPVIINEGQHDIMDVSRGSDGMIEMFDFAFVMIAKKYLHLSSHPIYLDEYSTHMDHAHREEAVLLIKSLMDQSAFSQIYLVSHNYAQYTALANAQFCVLNPDNIVVPEHYNEHVKFL